MNVDLMSESWMVTLAGNSCDGAPFLPGLLACDIAALGDHSSWVRQAYNEVFFFFFNFTNQGTLDLLQNIAAYSVYLHCNDNSYHSLNTYEVTGNCKAWRLFFWLKYDVNKI